MHRQTAGRVRGPAGKLKNCEQWALYEDPEASETAVLCNGGGFYEGDYYEECPSKIECRRATIEKRRDTDRRHLPVMNPPRPFRPQPQSDLQSRLTQLTSNLKKFEPYAPTTIPTKPTQQTQQASTEQRDLFPRPVIPPEQYPAPMRTPFASPNPFHMGGITPTFLPDKKEEVIGRLAKNIVQGWVGSTGWHVFDFARSVDMFG